MKTFSVCVKFLKLTRQWGPIDYSFKICFVPAPFRSWLSNFWHLTIWRYRNVRGSLLSLCIAQDNTNDQNGSLVMGPTPTMLGPQLMSISTIVFEMRLWRTIATVSSMLLVDSPRQYLHCLGVVGLGHWTLLWNFFRRAYDRFGWTLHEHWEAGLYFIWVHVISRKLSNIVLLPDSINLLTVSMLSVY